MVGPAGLDAVCADAVNCSGGFVKGPVEREEANGSGELGCGIAEGLAMLAEVVVPRRVIKSVQFDDKGNGNVLVCDNYVVCLE